jgi:hypothetical protein
LRKSKSALFLMELIIIIFFFALTSAVCLRVFVTAHMKASDTKGLNSAILWADNAFECFKEFKDDTEMVETTLADAFTLTDYSYELSFSEDDEFVYMDYSFYGEDDHTLIYSYTFKQHILKESEG